MDYHDPITQVIVQGSSYQANVITIDSFIKDVAVNDICSQVQMKINWNYQGIDIKNDENTLLLNRMCHIPKRIFNFFRESDQEYALAELQAYFGFALNMFNKIDPKINEYGCIPSYSLPYQWEKIKNEYPSFETLEYYWGDKKYCHLKSNDNLVYSDIYQYNLWSKQHSLVNKTDSVFCFREPKGVPLIVFVIGKSVLYSHRSLQDQSKKQLNRILLELVQTFGYFICEILLFINHDQITFACISPYIIQSHVNAQFEETVNHEITRIAADYEQRFHATRVSS